MVRPAVLGLIAVALAVYTAFNLRVGTDLTNFLPDDDQSELAEISGRLTDSPFTRTMLLSIEADETDVAIAAAKALTEQLAASPEVAWVRSGIDPTQMEDLYSLYFPRRLHFLSADPEREIPDRLNSSELRRTARSLKEALASPVGGMLTRLAPEDPLSAFRSIVERFQQGDQALKMDQDQFVTKDGRFAILMLATRASAFQSGPQTRLLDHIESSFATIAEQLGSSLRLEMSGGNRFAVAAERSMKGDIYLIGACSMIGVATLFMSFVGGWRAFWIVSIPPLSGILVATAAALAILGDLDGLTMVFGASLMGIAIDYSNHVLIHHRLAPSGEAPAETLRRIRPSLILGAATTVASFGGLAMTAFPAFREMSFFAAVGVITALLAALGPLPDLLRFVPPLPERSARFAVWLGDKFEALQRVPRVWLLSPLAIVPLAIVPISQLEWNDDMSKLTSFPPELIEEGNRVRARVSARDSNQFAIGVAKDEAEAIALNDQIHARLERAIDANELSGQRSLHRFLWSEDLQRRNWAALTADPTLYERLDVAFVAEGFRPGTFRKFGEALKQSPPPTLTLQDLRSSPLADLLAPFVFPLGDRIAVVTYLDGMPDPAAVSERLADLESVYLLDQRTFVNDIYGEFRQNTLQQIVVGGGLVLLILVVRYRNWRRFLAAFVPSVVVAAILLSIFSLSGVRANLLHAMALIMVMGMGVDYGVFLVDSADDREAVGATMLSLLMSCLTTVFVFGTLSLSEQPALRAIGVTTGLGIALSYLLAPITLAAMRRPNVRGEHEP